MIVASVAKRVSQADGVMTKSVLSMDPVILRAELDWARGLFFMHMRESGQELMAIDDLMIELKAAAFTENRQQVVVRMLTEAGITDLSLVDWLAYMPLFLAAHNSIVLNPLDGWA